MIDWAELDRFKFFDEKDTINSPSLCINFNNNSKGIIEREAIDIVRRSRAMSAKKKTHGEFFRRIWNLVFRYGSQSGWAALCSPLRDRDNTDK